MPGSFVSSCHPAIVSLPHANNLPPTAIPQAATAKLNGNAHAAVEARLRDVEAAAAEREAALRKERDELAAKCAGLQLQIADLQTQLKAAKVTSASRAFHQQGFF